jgi:hypothetical protein
MLFRDAQGKLIEINKYDYKNDYIYYKKILKTKNFINNHPKEINYSKIIIQNSISLTK